MQMFKYFSSAVTAKSIILILFSDNSFTNWSSDLTRVLSDYIFDDAAYAGARADQGGPRLPGEDAEAARLGGEKKQDPFRVLQVYVSQVQFESGPVRLGLEER